MQGFVFLWCYTTLFNAPPHFLHLLNLGHMGLSFVIEFAIIINIGGVHLHRKPPVIESKHIEYEKT